MATAKRYHIGKNGVPEVCRAGKQKCPYDSGGHYETQAEAAEVSQRRLEEEYGIIREDSVEAAETRTLGGLTYAQATYTDNSASGAQETGFQMILNPMTEGLSARSRAGLSYEAFGAYQYANDLGLENVVITAPDKFSKVGKKGKEGEDTFYSNLDADSANAAYNTYYDRTKKIMDEKLRMQGIDPRSNVVRAVYFSDDGETAVVHMGGPDVLDIAVIKNGEAEFIEFKKVSGQGAQLSNTTLSVSETGQPRGNMSHLDKHVAEQVRRVGFKETFGTNVPVNLTNREALAHVVDSYKKKGADKFTYLNKKNEVVEVDLTGSTESAVKAMEERNLKATVRLRSNLTYNVPTELDKERWQTKRGDIFKSGTFPSEDTFKVGDLKASQRSQLESCSKRATIGEVVFPFTPAEFRKLSPDTEIKVSDLRVRGLNLIGDIKEKSDSKK